MQSWTLTYGIIASSLAISFASRVVVEHRNPQPEISISIGLLARAGHKSDIDKARNLGQISQLTCSVKKPHDNILSFSNHGYSNHGCDVVA